MDVLMCEPTYFDVLVKDPYGNTHMNPNNKPDVEHAFEEWAPLVKVYRALGIIARFINPVPGLFDMTFTANCGFTFIKNARKYVLLSNFRPERRRREKECFEFYFRNTLGYSTISLVNGILYFEGAGDALPFAGTILAGHGFRTSEKTIPYLAEHTGKTVIPLELKKPDEGDTIPYHLDTTMIVIDSFNEPTIIVYRGAFTDSSYTALEQEVRSRAGHLFEASYQDFATLALNATVIPKRDIILDKSLAEYDATIKNHCKNIASRMDDQNVEFRGVIVTSDTASDDLLDTIRSCGYYPITLPLGEFLKAGGGAFCLTKILL